jgi:hypothetical protein
LQRARLKISMQGRGAVLAGRVHTGSVACARSNVSAFPKREALAFIELAGLDGFFSIAVKEGE